MEGNRRARQKSPSRLCMSISGGKEGLYAVICGSWMRALTGTLTAALDDPTVHRARLWRRTARFLRSSTYIEENAEGFQVLVRDSPSTDPSGSIPAR